MIEILAFLGLVTVLMILAYYINYRVFGEELSLNTNDFLIFLFHNQQNRVKQVKISVFLTIINKGLKNIKITDISLNLLPDKIQIPFTLATKSQFLISEESSLKYPFQINKNDRYDTILSFTPINNLGEELMPFLITKEGRETVFRSNSELKLTIKYGTGKKRNFSLKLNLDEKTITNLPEITDDKVILPIEMFNILWKIKNRQKVSPRKLYRW
jgi:hypothetical protein